MKDVCELNPADEERWQRASSDADLVRRRELNVMLQCLNACFPFLKSDFGHLKLRPLHGLRWRWIKPRITTTARGNKLSIAQALLLRDRGKHLLKTTIMSLTAQRCTHHMQAIAVPSNWQQQRQSVLALFPARGSGRHRPYPFRDRSRYLLSLYMRARVSEASCSPKECLLAGQQEQMPIVVSTMNHGLISVAR